MTQEPIIDPDDLDINIVNVVATASLDQKINLLDIMKVFRNVEYRPKQFPGLVSVSYTHLTLPTILLV